VLEGLTLSQAGETQPIYWSTSVNVGRSLNLLVLNHELTQIMHRQQFHAKGSFYLLSELAKVPVITDKE
jgi:hypothetical protein